MENKYKNTIFWAWNKEMADDEIRRQIFEMSERGIGGFFIHSRAGLTIPYMGEEWFCAVQTAVEAAEQYGMDVWLYDEDGWPSGFAGGKVPAQGDIFRMKHLMFSQEAEKIPEDKIIAAYRKEGNAYVQDESARDLIAYYVADRHYVDLLDERTTEKFIESTHDRYKERFSSYFGRVIKGIFTDEPQLYRTEAWSFCLCDEFEKEYGESLLPQLWKLYKESGKSELRYKLGALRSKLFTNSYVRKIAQWCTENGLMLTGHLADEDGLCMSSKATGGTIVNYREMQMPGIDFLGRRLASPVLLKQVQSAKNQFEKPLVLSESFGCCGWNTPFSDYAWIWGYQAAFGINQACMHLGAYSIIGCRKRDYPAFFSYQEPWWDELGILNRWMYNVNSYLSEFRSEQDVLVISPLQNMYAYESYSEESRYISNQFRILVEALIECQVGFDIGDETIFQNSGRTDGAVIRAGSRVYKTVIVPDAESLKKSTWTLLEAFAKGGGKVIFTNRRPQFCEFREESKVFAVNGPTVMNRADLWGKFFRDSSYARSVRVSSIQERYAAKDIVVYNGKNDCGDTVCYIVNLSTESEKNLLVQFFEDGTVFEYDFSKAKEIPVVFERGEAGVFTKILLPRKGIRCYVRKSTQSTLQQATTEEKSVIRETLSAKKIVMSQPNCLMLDYACYSIDGGEFSEQMPVIHMQEKIYRALNKLNKTAITRVLYPFTCTYPVRKLSLWVEEQRGQRVYINGRLLEKKQSESWLDKDFAGYAVEKLLRMGENEIVIENRLTPYDRGFDPEQVFETEKNRFFYPVEFESVYLRGNFAVSYSGEIFTNSNFFRLQGGTFCIEEERSIPDRGDITGCGYWFYRGKVRYSFSIEGAEKIGLWLNDVKAPVATMYVNGKSVGVYFDFSRPIRLDRLLREGKNEVVIELCSSNRNLLGPHHHRMGEVDFVGVNTFKGTKGYEDCILNPSLPDNTFTPDYSFVPFGMSGITVEKYDR